MLLVTDEIEVLILIEECREWAIDARFKFSHIVFSVHICLERDVKDGHRIVL